MDREFDISGIGSVVKDSIYGADKILGPESKGFAELKGVYPGGVALNHLCWARVLGVKAALFGVGAGDEDGQYIRQKLDQYGVNHNWYLKTGTATGRSEVFVDSKGERAIYMNTGANYATRAADIAAFGPLMRQSRFVSSEISQLRLETVLKVLTLARKNGCRTFLDLDVPPSVAVAQRLGSRGQVMAALKSAHYLKSSVDAASEFVPRQRADKMALNLHRKLGKTPGREWVALTAGRNGCGISDGFQSLAVPAIKGIKAKDSTGAGDAFMGGLIAGMVYGLGLKDMAMLANAAGAAKVTQYGAVPSLKDARELVRHLYKGRALTMGAYEPRSDKDGKDLSHGARFAENVLAQMCKTAQGLDGGSLNRAKELILSGEKAGGRLHMTGIGKCSYVARYAASSFSSTGTTALFLDATEAAHGASGQVKHGEVVVAVSNSGETQELNRAVSLLKRNGAKIIGVSGKRKSALAGMSDVFLFAGVDSEGDRLGLAPRASILAQTLVLLALGVELQEAKRFTARDFLKYHPAGRLGRAKN